MCLDFGKMVYLMYNKSPPGGGGGRVCVALLRGFGCFVSDLHPSGSQKLVRTYLKPGFLTYCGLRQIELIVFT